MRMVDLIARKRHGAALSEEESAWWVNAFVRGEVPDYQVSAMLMAICFSGLSREETVALTLAMAKSGEMIDLSGIAGVTVDKHSTGGVGDSTTLICAPIAAACGAKVAKLSGRGLGHTGGTVDKLESIPGFNCMLSPAEFIRIVQSAGLAITGASAELVPADKMLYALRDVTATVDCIPLIASSIMSKKIAAGASAIVLDVKFGSGAIMTDLESALSLAEEMVAIGRDAGRRTVAVLTDMDQPLGMTVGNSLDIAEAVRILQGQETGALLDLSLILASEMLLVAGIAPHSGTAAKMTRDALDSGRAWEAFRAMVAAQGGDLRAIDHPSRLPTAAYQHVLPAPASGWISAYDTVAIGQVSVLLGAGRSRKEDTIDHAAGIVLQRRVGDRIEKAEPLAVLHTSAAEVPVETMRALGDAIHIADHPPPARPLLWGRVSERGTERFA